MAFPEIFRARARDLARALRPRLRRVNEDNSIQKYRNAEAPVYNVDTQGGARTRAADRNKGWPMDIGESPTTYERAREADGVRRAPNSLGARKLRRKSDANGRRDLA